MALNTGYFRYPTIAGETIAFVSEDDVWSVPASGGPARRLTAGLSEVSRPLLSPDGELLAFTSREEHHAEVFCMPATGGPARRITWMGGAAVPRTWLDDGRLLFVNDRTSPFAGSYEAFTVRPDGGPVERLPFGPVREVAFGPDGAVVLGRNTADPARWKRYRGGTAGELWIDPRGTGSFRRLLQLKGNMAGPMWIGRRVFFLSDHEGVGNIYSCRPDGRDVQRHTDHHEYYARFPMTDGRRITYQHAADVWLLDPASGEAALVPIDFGSPRVQRNRRFVKADKYRTGTAVHPTGRSVALETRGKLFTMPLWEEAVRQHGRPDGVRYRLSQWTHDGNSVVTVSDEEGEDAIEVHPAQADTPGGEWRRISGIDLGAVTELAASPTAAQVAVVNQRRELLLVDLDTGTSRLLDRSEHGGLDWAAWSPDGRWLAYSFAASINTRSIKLCEVASGNLQLVTAPEFRDIAPTWDPKGEFLYFLSYRVFDPVYDELFFDLGFPRAMKPYLVTLRNDVVSPFVPKPRGLGPETPSAAGASTTNGNKPADKKSDPPPEVRIDLDGIGRRVVAFPVDEGRYTNLAAIPGKVLYSSEPVQGSLTRDFFSTDAAPTGTLEAYDLAEQKHDTLINGISWFQVSRDSTTLVYGAGTRVRAIKAGEKPPENTDHEPPGRASGWLDLERVRVSVDPGAEWHQMLGEAWRLQREYFWVEDMSGVDWDEVRRRYTPLVDKVATRAEFSDLMWEMQGELGTSHAYEIGGDHRSPPPYAMGFLGADLELDEKSGRWGFAHIVSGDAWQLGVDSPLHTPGVNVADGDTLLAVGGREVGRDLDPASLLVNQAGMAVELTVGDGRGRKPRRVVVTTLTDERPARYREWVSEQRRAVAETTGGRVGYVHVPDMGAHGYAEFHRAYLAAVDGDALIVDVRNNGGGHVSPLVLEKLARKRIGYDVARWAPPQAYPPDSPAGPLVAITDEHAGSDGDIFTHCFKLLGLGPVVGKRTWGGVIGISPTHRLVDGSMTTQPAYSFWFVDVGWGVENYGTDPDYDVDIRPQDYAAGRDPQLEKAIELVLKALKRHRPTAADVANRPVLALPVLPPRGAPENGASTPKKRAAKR